MSVIVLVIVFKYVMIFNNVCMDVLKSSFRREKKVRLRDKKKMLPIDMYKKVSHMPK